MRTGVFLDVEKTGGEASLDRPCRKRPLFSTFPHVCPEPVLANIRCLLEL